MARGGLAILGEPQLLVLLADLALRIRMALGGRHGIELAVEGLKHIRRAFDLDGDDAPRVELAGVTWGSARGWIVVNLTVLTPAAVEALKPWPKKLRLYAQGVALIDEALRWNAAAGWEELELYE